jgi:hypothetical protein
MEQSLKIKLDMGCYYEKVYGLLPTLYEGNSRRIMYEIQAQVNDEIENLKK